MGTFMDINLDEFKEPEVVEEGEYQVRVIGVNGDDNGGPRVSQNGKAYYTLVLTMPEIPTGATIFHNVFIPNKDTQDPKAYNSTGLRLKNMIAAFGVESISSLSDLVGATCWAKVGLEESVEYGRRNNIKQFVRRV